MSWFERKKKKNPREFTFSVAEIIANGDFYKYTVKADSKKEAFKKLVQYFYGVEHIPIDEIKSDSGIVSQPQKDSFTYSGMPWWFAKLISGGQATHYKDLERYAKKNNIQLKK